MTQTKEGRGTKNNGRRGATSLPHAPRRPAAAMEAVRHPGPPPHPFVVHRPPDEEPQQQLHRRLAAAAGPRAGADPRQPAPAGRAAAPEPPRAGAAARPRDAAAAGRSVSGGGVVGRGGAGGDQDARRRLLQQAGLVGAQAPVLQPQGRGLRALRRVLERDAQALHRRAPQHAPRQGRVVRARAAGI
jgi:hypothetical protein